MQKNKTITEIIDTDYMEYALYTLEQRAIPSAIDGMKIVQRKILYAMINKYGGKKTKLNDLGSISNLNYHHGEVSAISAAVGMAQEWNNNSPLFLGHGSFGSRMIQEAAAPRYIYASLSENYKKIFIDDEVCPKSHDDENPEPAFYLPIIPWVLVNGVLGLSVGFKVSVLPRSLSDIIVATKTYLKAPEKFLESNALIPPTFPMFKGNTIVKGDNQWLTRGIVKFVGKNTYDISELPVGYDREGYVTLLNELIDKDLIKDYADECSKEGFGFKVKVTGAQKELIAKDLIKFFKLEKTHTEILTTMGIDGKLKIFHSVAELIGYFCDYRLKKFGDKIEFDKAKLLKEILVMTDKQKFIQLVLDGKIDFKKTTKNDLLQFIVDNVTVEDHGKRFINIPLYEITMDAWDDLYAAIEVAKSKLVELESLTPEKLYTTRLNAIKI